MWSCGRRDDGDGGGSDRSSLRSTVWLSDVIDRFTTTWGFSCLIQRSGRSVGELVGSSIRWVADRCILDGLLNLNGIDSCFAGECLDDRVRVNGSYGNGLRWSGNCEVDIGIDPDWGASDYYSSLVLWLEI